MSIRPLLIFCSVLFLLSATVHAQTKVFAGKIDNGDEIEMHLLEYNKQVFGYYFRNHGTVATPLHSRTSGQNVQLYDGDEIDGQLYFDGTFTDSTISGKWMQMGPSIFTPYSLKLIRVDTVSKDKAKLSGKYEAKGKDINKTAKVVYIDNKYFYFHLNMTSKKCTGYLHGVAKVQKGVKATYADSKCASLTFITANRVISLLEKDCTGYRGSTCKFDGTYQYKK